VIVLTPVMVGMPVAVLPVDTVPPEPSVVVAVAPEWAGVPAQLSGLELLVTAASETGEPAEARTDPKRPAPTAAKATMDARVKNFFMVSFPFDF
jgi:hypothetical protein